MSVISEKKRYMKKIRIVLWISIITLLGCLYLFADRMQIRQKISGFGQTMLTQGSIPLMQEEENESIPEHYAYYYEQMNTEDKQRYRELYQVMKLHGMDLNVSLMDIETVERIFQYILLDNPELFYVENLETQTITIANVKSMMKAATIENMDEKQQIEAKKAIDEFLAGFLGQISEQMSDEKKAELAFTYVVEQLEYVPNSPYNQTLYSAALGQTVCMGYTAAFKYLCDQMQIPCISVLGTLEGGDHAWNMVCLDHIWYQVDCTQGDALVTYPPKVDYRWYKRSSEKMKKTHVLSEPELLPVCR